MVNDEMRKEETSVSLYGYPRRALDQLRGNGSIPAAYCDETHSAPKLLKFWQVIIKRRSTILTVLFIVFAVALVATLKQKPLYRARALVEIQKENPDIPSLQELLQVENISDTYLETQYRILNSENLARRVISQLNLERRPDFAPTKDWLFPPAREASIIES